MPEPWRPGLPNVTCVGDVRIGGVVHECVLSRVETHGQGRFTSMHKHGARFALQVFSTQNGPEVEWRPVRAPDGAAEWSFALAVRANRLSEAQSLFGWASRVLGDWTPYPGGHA